MNEIRKILVGQLLAAMALATTESAPIEPYPMRRIALPKPKTPDPERQSAAQAKRERKAERRFNNYAKCVLGNAHIFMAKRKYEYMSKPCDCDVCTSKGGAA